MICCCCWCCFVWEYFIFRIVFKQPHILKHFNYSALKRCVAKLKRLTKGVSVQFIFKRLGFVVIKRSILRKKNHFIILSMRWICVHFTAFSLSTHIQNYVTCDRYFIISKNTMVFLHFSYEAGRRRYCDNRCDTVIRRPCSEKVMTVAL